MHMLEASARMLWALTQRRKDMDRARNEGREEGRNEGREEGLEAGRERTLLALMERGVELPSDILEELNGTRPA